MAGCTVGPDFIRPSAPDSATFRETPPVDGAGKSARPVFVDASATFWGSFGDATLDERIALSTKANQSVARADANYQAAQATVRVSRSALFWTFNVSAGESRSRSAQSGTRSPFWPARRLRHTRWPRQR